MRIFFDKKIKSKLHIYFHRTFVKNNANLEIRINIFCLYGDCIYPAAVGIGNGKNIVNILAIEVGENNDSLYASGHFVLM